MQIRSFMLIAGEPSGDALAAELVRALQTSPSLAAQPFPPEFFGAGGLQMKAAGVELLFDLTEHAVFGVSDVLKQYAKFRRLFRQLYRSALARKPDAIILVDYAGFNRRFARAIQRHVRSRENTFHNWRPKLIYYVSPQVWASREGRAFQLARDVDLLLSIFPFEKAWHAQRIPSFRVEWVGHPMLDRFEADSTAAPNATPRALHNHLREGSLASDSPPPLVLLLPGSREREVRSHLPPMIETFRRLRANQNLRGRVVLPNERLRALSIDLVHGVPEMEVRVGGLPASLREATLTIASSGTVTLECAYFRVPTVVIYKTSWLTCQIARRIVRVKYIAMPNIIGDELIYPELIQEQASADAITAEALDLLNNSARRQWIESKLDAVVSALGAPGASRRAAEAVLSLFR